MKKINILEYRLLKFVYNTDISEIQRQNNAESDFPFLQRGGLNQNLTFRKKRVYKMCNSYEI